MGIAAKEEKLSHHADSDGQGCAPIRWNALGGRDQSIRGRCAVHEPGHVVMVAVRRWWQSVHAQHLLDGEIVSHGRHGGSRDTKVCFACGLSRALCQPVGSDDRVECQQPNRSLRPRVNVIQRYLRKEKTRVLFAPDTLRLVSCGSNE